MDPQQGSRRFNTLPMAAPSAAVRSRSRPHDVRNRSAPHSNSLSSGSNMPNPYLSGPPNLGVTGPPSSIPLPIS